MANRLHRAFLTLSHLTIGRVCDHLMDRKHTRAHRIAVGVGVMGCGVLIAKAAAFFDFEPIRVVCDGFGYMIHAAGATPLLEAAFAPFSAPEVAEVAESLDS